MDIDILLVVCVVVAVFVGAAITYFLIGTRKSKEKIDCTKDLKLQSENEQLLKEGEKKRADYENQIAELRNVMALEFEKKEVDCEDKIKRLKQKYEVLLAESKSQIEILDSQMKEVLNGNIDETVQNQLEDASRLKKEIKRLQEEIEDYEDEVEEQKAKFKKKNSENEELKNEIEKTQKEIRGIKEELEATKNDLEDKTSELKLKTGSLSFIQEILTAEQVSDNSTKALHEKVYHITRFVSEELKDCIKNLKLEENEKVKISKSDLEKWANLQKKSWIQGKTTIAFVGEFSAGKTSIVNRILSQDDPSIPRLPVSTKATTAIPTYISGGVSTRYQFVAPDQTLKVISEETFKRVDKDVLDQVKGVSALISYFVMTYKNEHLEKLSILDTPGFNSNDKEDAERTIGVINECDALFWVFDVNSGTVNKSSISLIKAHLQKPLYVVINKVDTKPEVEVDKVEQLIRKTLQEEGVAVENFIRFSGKEKLSTIMEPIKSIKRDTKQDAYIECLMNSLQELENELHVKVKEKRQKHEGLDNQANALNSNFSQVLNLLSFNAETAARLPQWKEHFFSKDKFEMSELDGNRLKYILGEIANTQAYSLRSLNNDSVNCAKEVQTAYRTFMEEKGKYVNFINCKEQLEKLVKQLRK